MFPKHKILSINKVNVRDATEIPRGTRYQRFEKRKNQWYHAYWNWNEGKWGEWNLCDPQPLFRYDYNPKI